MGRLRTSMKNIREVIRLFDLKNESNRKIARSAHVSRPVVAEYIQAYRDSGLSYNDFNAMPDDILTDLLFHKNNPADRERFSFMQSKISDYLIELRKPGVTAQILWEEYKLKRQGAYSYSQFCYYLQVARKMARLSMHIDLKAGDKMFVDFTGAKMYITDMASGSRHAVEIFVAILGASGLIYAEAVKSQKKDDWIDANQNSLRYFGGVTKAIVPDCLKSGVTKANKYEPAINPEYADFASHYNTVILPARPYKPKDKAWVENAVRIVYRRIFAPLRNITFYSLDSLNEAIREELEKLNSLPMQRIKLSRWELFNRIEKNELMPLPAEKYEHRKFCRVKVQPSYHIYLNDDIHYYSVPYRYRNMSVEVLFTHKIVEIYRKNVRIALHQRDKTVNGYTTNPDHLPPQHRYVYDWNPETFIEKSKSIGSAAEEFFREILKTKQHPEQGYKICSGILSLRKKYGDEHLNKACGCCHSYKMFSYIAVKNILENGVEKITEEENKPQTLLPFHANIRGREYYLTVNFKNNNLPAPQFGLPG